MRQGMGKGSEGCAKGGERRKGERLRCGEEKEPPPPQFESNVCQKSSDSLPIKSNA